MEKLWIRWMQYWITYFKANNSNRSFWSFYRGNTEDVWCKNSEVHMLGCSLILSYIQQDQCLHSYTEWLPLLPFMGSINWLTSLISKNSIYYSMEAGLTFSSSVCPGNLTEFLEGPGCTILKAIQFSPLSKSLFLCSHRKNFFFHHWQLQKHPDADNLKMANHFSRIKINPIQSNISPFFRKGLKTGTSHINMSFYRWQILRGNKWNGLEMYIPKATSKTAWGCIALSSVLSWIQMNRRLILILPNKMQHNLSMKSLE